MSFRNRLLFFFVVIVIVPMIAVAIVLFRLISSDQTGRYNAGVTARANAATAIYQQDATAGATRDAAAHVAHDPQLGAALDHGDIGVARQRAKMLVSVPDGAVGSRCCGVAGWCSACRARRRWRRSRRA
jgi:hypothetical protein